MGIMILSLEDRRSNEQCRLSSTEPPIVVIDLVGDLGGDLLSVRWKNDD
jgi:hypothetical protein